MSPKVLKVLVERNKYKHTDGIDRSTTSGFFESLIDLPLSHLEDRLRYLTIT